MSDSDDKVVSLYNFRKRKVQEEIDTQDAYESEAEPYRIQDSDIISLIRVMIYLRDLGNTSTTMQLLGDQLSVEINSFESFDDDPEAELMTGERYTMNAVTKISDHNGDLCSDEKLLERVKDMILSVDINMMDDDEYDS